MTRFFTAMHKIFPALPFSAMTLFLGAEQSSFESWSGACAMTTVSFRPFGGFRYVRRLARRILRSFGQNTYSSSKFRLLYRTGSATNSCVEASYQTTARTTARNIRGNY